MGHVGLNPFKIYIPRINKMERHESTKVRVALGERMLCKGL